MYRPQNQRNYQQKSYVKRNFIENGACGVFFTVDGEEGRAVKEAMNILDLFSAQLAKSVDGDAALCPHDPVEKQDVSDQLTKMCESSKTTSNTIRFRQLDTGVRNTIFFCSDAIDKDNVYKLVDLLVEDCQKDKRCRFLAKVLPVEETCPVNMDAIATSLKQMIRSHLHDFTAIDAEPPTFAVDFKQRNNDHLKRLDVINVVTSVMEELSPNSKVDLTDPDLVFAVNVVKRTTMLSCIRSYFRRNRFGIRIPSEKENTDKNAELVD